MKKTLLIPAILAALAASAAVPIVVEVETSETRTRYLDVFRGETVDLEVQFDSYGDRMSFTNGTPADVWWQTNGMGSAWWHAPASVSTDGVARASWTPAMDCGADRYGMFVGVGGEDRSYRAAFAVRMHGAPGPHPNEIAPPVQLLDFAKIAVTNAPWGDAGLSTNDVRAIIEANAGPTNRLLHADSNGELKMSNGNSAFPVILSGLADGQSTGGLKWDARGFEGYFVPEAGMFWAWYMKNKKFILPMEKGGTEAHPAEVAITDEITAATNGMATAEEIAQLRTDASLVYQLLMGSNVVAEVTNYNSRVHAPSFRLLQLDPDSNEYITVWAETNGLTRTLNESRAHTDAATNALARAKADRAWSHHTSGLGADAPAGVTWISTPETVIAGGYEYAKQITSHGEVWVLTSNGLGLGEDTNSFFAVKSGDGETLFSIEKTDSVLVGVDADGINVSGGVVTIPIGVVSQDPPVCYAANSLVNATWTDLTQAPLPAWVTSATCTGTPGAWVWTIETTAPSAFFQFRVLQPGATVIRNNAQTDLSAGILINGTRYYPHASGGTLTWTTTP